jgi:hypothetical protein
MSAAPEASRWFGAGRDAGPGEEPGVEIVGGTRG